jgi:hypothetical protein
MHDKGPSVIDIAGIVPNDEETGGLSRICPGEDALVGLPRRGRGLHPSSRQIFTPLASCW